MTLQSANHTVIRVVNTMQCHMIHRLVWHAHFNILQCKAYRDFGTPSKNIYNDTGSNTNKKLHAFTFP